MRLRIVTFTLTALCLTTSCKTSTSSVKETEIPADLSASKAKPGMGWNSDKENFAGVCLNGETEEIGSQTSSVRFTSSMSKEELFTMLGFSMSAKAKYGFYKGSAAANFSAENAEDKFSSVTIYSARYEFKNAFFTAKDLSEVGNRVNQKQEMWEEGCGHEFVQQAVKGASLLIAARIDFVSSEAKSEFNAKFKLKGPAFSVAGELKKASEEFKEKATISISAYQKGGDVGRLGTAFASPDGSGGEALIRCSMADVDRCSQVLSNLVNYATSDKPGNFSDQIKDNGGESGGADLMYIAYPYSTAGIFPPDALMRELLYEQRRAVEEKLNRNIFLRNRKNLFSSLTNIPNAASLWSRLNQIEKQNSQLISEAIKSCFDRVKVTDKNGTKASCDSTLSALNKDFQDIPDSELEIRQADLPACDKGYVRSGLGCERISCGGGHKYEETWTTSISGGTGSFVCNETGSDQLTSVSCDGNSEAAGLSCIPRSCGTHPHNDTWSDAIANGSISRKCDFGVIKLVTTSCESGYFDEGGSCKQRAAEAPPPETPKAVCKEERTGRIVNSGDKSITNKCVAGRVVESICTCENGSFSNPCQTSNLGNCHNGGFNPRLIDH